VNVLTLPLFGPVAPHRPDSSLDAPPSLANAPRIQHQKRFELAAPKCRHNDFAATSSLHILGKLFSSSMRNGL
jgi:hypothetical protein